MVPYKMPKVTLFYASHMQCIINLCNTTNKIYTHYMHFRGFHAQKSVCFRPLPWTGPSPKSPPLLWAFGLKKYQIAIVVKQATVIRIISLSARLQVFIIMKTVQVSPR